MHIKVVGNALFIMGVVIVLASLFADSLGIGGSAGFGPGQIIGLLVGPGVAIVGYRLRAQSD